MPVTSDSLFGLQQLGESVALFDEPGQELMLQDKIFTPEECASDVYRFDRTDFDMAFAPFVGGRGSPSKGVKVQDKRVDLISLAHIRISKTFLSKDLFTQRAPGEISDNAAVEIAKVRKSLRRRCRLARERICAMALRGTVTVNAANFPDSDTNISIVRAVTDLSAPSATWATAGTKIISDDLQDWREEVRQASGFEPARALFSKSVVKYLLQNTEAKDWLNSTQKGVSQFSTARFNELGGLEAWDEHKGFYIPEGSTATPFISADEFFLLPAEAQLRMICRLVEGFGEIPMQALGYSGPPEGRKAATPGYVEYVIPTDGDPAGFKIVASDYFMAVVKLPVAIGYQDDVTP